MCEACRVEHGVTALEALANGEDVPEPADVPMGATPVPMIVAEFGDKIGIVTTREGWGALKAMMALVGGIREMPDGD